jgi:nicotinamidase-related amidase
LVREAGDALDAITLTLDSHHAYDVAHPGFWWADTWGAEVIPFTQITAAQVRAGQFQPRDPAALPRTLAYLDALEAQGRYTLMVWPVHCAVGTWGHQLHDAVRAACADWELRRQRASHVVFKGLNPWTEHYSALQAEVPDPADPETGLNRALIARLDTPGRLLIAGEAGSHCVRATVEHLVAHLPDPTSERLSRLTLLTDAISPVGGFEAQQAAFFEDMRQRGVRLATCAEVIAEMKA